VLNQLLEVVFLVDFASEVRAQMACDPCRQGGTPVSFAEDWNKFVIVVRDQSLCGHQVLFVANASESFISSLLVCRSANQEHKVAGSYRRLHEMWEFIAEFEMPLIDDNLESVRFEPESKL
jgi:hypothetical protein